MFVPAFQEIEETLEQAGRAVDVGLTIRNWCIGCHVQEFAQRGVKRAGYGERIFEELSVRLKRDRSRHRFETGPTCSARSAEYTRLATNRDIESAPAAAWPDSSIVQGDLARIT